MEVIRSDRNIIIFILFIFTWILGLHSEALPTLPSLPFAPGAPFRPKKTCRQNITKEEAISKYLPHCASCRGKCGTIVNTNQWSQQGCSCDSSCVAYKDCCHDFKTHCPEEARNNPDLITNQPALCRSIDDEDCVKDYLLIGSCKKKDSACAISKDSLNLFVPVFDVKRKLHFVNLNCAVCNGAKDVIPWNATLACVKPYEHNRKNLSETITKEEFNELWKSCYVYLLPDEGAIEKPRRCIQPWRISSEPCDPQCAGTKFQRLCQAPDEHKTYLQPRPPHPSSFSNFFCLLCVEPDPTDILKKTAECSLDVPKIACLGKPISFSFQLLFDVSLRHGLTVGEEPVLDCGEKQVWVEAEDRCRDLYSPLEMDNYNKTKGVLNIVFKIINGTSTPEMITKIKKLTWNFSVHVQQIEPMLLDDVTLALTLFTTNVTAITKENYMKATKTWFADKDITLLYFTNLTTQVNCDTDYLVYNQSEYIFLTNNRIKLLATDRTVKPGKFKIASNYTVRVCPEPGGLKFDAMSIVTIVCLSLSIIALTLRLVLHCVLSDGGPARLQVSLAVSLLLAMVTFLLSPLFLNYFSVCYTVAVLIHWAFLAAFCWMTVIGWDILNMFKATSDFQRIGQGNKKFVFYSLYSWGFPTIVCCIALAVDHSNVDLIWRPAFAKKLCWFSGKVGLLLFFVSPVALQILINIIIFIVCCFYLQRSKMPAGRTSIEQHEERQRFLLYLKLFILMGITWVVGFLVIPLDSDVLWYIFIILNASQGILLLIVYVVGKRARQKLTETLSKLSSSASTSSTGVTSQL